MPVKSLERCKTAAGTDAAYFGFFWVSCFRVLQTLHRRDPNVHRPPHPARSHVDVDSVADQIEAGRCVIEMTAAWVEQYTSTNRFTATACLDAILMNLTAIGLV
jgi:hypothetical protein